MHIAAVVDIAKSVGSPRILRGNAITCPVGNPSLNNADEKALRKRYMQKALEMLSSDEKPGSVQVIGNI